MDIVGVLPRALRNKKFLIATIDYFSKWIKVESLAQIREVGVKQFIHNNILSQFSIFRDLVSDNGTQFVVQKAKKMLDKLKIEFYNSIPRYPQCNGHLEAFNKIIMNGIKKDLKKPWANGSRSYRACSGLAELHRAQCLPNE